VRSGTMVCATMRAAHAQTVVERSAVGLNDLLCYLTLGGPEKKLANQTNL
jgi:hypothetical protein